MARYKSRNPPPVAGADGLTALPFDDWLCNFSVCSDLASEGYIEVGALSDVFPVSVTPEGAPISNRRYGSQILRNPYDPLPLARGWSCCIDGLRVRFSYLSSSLAAVWDRLDMIDLQQSWDSRTFEHSYKIGSYARSITFTDVTGGTATCLLGRYVAHARDIAPEVVLDVNPSKCSRSLFDWLLRCLFLDCLGSPVVLRYDLAFDMPVKRSSVQLLRQEGRHYCKIFSADGALTEYVGRRQHTGYVKLYDKAAESGLPGDLTRLEFTLSSDAAIPQECTFCVFELDQQLFFDLPFPVVACSLHPELLPILKQSVSPNTWTKYKSMLSDRRTTFWRLDPDDYLAVREYVSNFLDIF